MDQSQCSWCQRAKWTVECDECARPSGVQGAVRHCQSCSDVWHAVGASQRHVRREKSTMPATTSREDALEVQIQEKMLLLQQALDAPQESAHDTTVTPTADRPTRADASKSKTQQTAAFNEHTDSSDRPCSMGRDATNLSLSTDTTSSSISDDSKPNDGMTSTFPGDDAGQEIIVIDDDDDDDAEDDAEDAYDDLNQLDPLDPDVVDQLLAMCTIQDAVNCVHYRRCPGEVCIEASVHQEHCVGDATCPDNSAMCRAFAKLMRHCEACPTAATCGVCVLVAGAFFLLLVVTANALVLQRRLQYKHDALCHALGGDGRMMSPSFAAEHFRDCERRSLKMRKATCEVEIKETIDTIRRLRLPTTKLPPIRNHFRHEPLPTWKRLRDPISEYMFQGNADNTNKWTEWVEDGLRIVNAMECKYMKYCQRECAAWMRSIQNYTAKHKTDPTTVLSSREGAAIARHLAHYPCKFRQCMYCTMMRRTEFEVKHAMATLCASKLVGLLSRERNPATLRQIEAKFRRFQAFQVEISKKLRWFAEALPQWSRAHTPVIESAGSHYKI